MSVQSIITISTENGGFMSEFIQEYTAPSAVRLKIDKAQGILHGVKILGTQSKNRRRYPVDTLKKAIPLYENAKVNLDHPDGDPAKPRSYTDRLGVIKGVQLQDEQGLFADFHFNPNHPLAEQLLWDAEHAPTNVGFSHNVEAVLRRENDEVIVDEIVAVRSVDLVADPATTAGLFESHDENTLNCDTIQKLEEQVESLTVSLAESRKQNESFQRSVNASKIFRETMLECFNETNSHIASFFRTPFLEAVERCSGEEEIRRLVSDRLELVRQITEQDAFRQSQPKCRPQSIFPTPQSRETEHKNFIEAIKTI